MLLNYAFSSKLKHTTEYDDYKDISAFRSLYFIDSDPFLVDRTNCIAFPFSEKNHFPMIKAKPEVMTWEECTKDRVEELTKTNKKLYLMWSGGIDSTLMLLSFIKYGDRSQITVVLNMDSIREYPFFYKSWIGPLYKMISTEEFMRTISNSDLDGLVVSAEHADQLVGSPLAQLVSDTSGRTMLGLPFDEENFHKCLLNLRVPLYHIDIIMEIYNRSIKYSPRPINTMWDWCWWHGFNFKWQTIFMKLAIRAKNTSNITTFFSSENFQNTSIHQEGNTTDFKQTFKDIILKFTFDDKYMDKHKFASSTLYYGLNSPAGLDNNWRKISVKDFNLLDYYNKDNTIKGIIDA